MPKKANNFRILKISKPARRLIAYWRDSLEENDREDLSSQYIREFSQRIPESDAARGHCSPELHRTLAQRFEQQRGKGKESGETFDRNAPLSVVICPLRFERKEIAEGVRFVEVLWLPALLLQSGILQPPEERLPWISRDVLEPSGSDEYPIVGSLRAVDKFSNKNLVNSWRSWNDYLKFADSFVRAVTGKTISKLRIRGYERADRALVLLERKENSSTNSLIEILDGVLEDQLSAGVLAKFAATENVRRRPYRRDKATLAADARKHLGHFTGDFPLSHSQRMAIHRTLELRDGEFLPVTGPPGTGKTTVLQSIIATLWVRAALQRAGRPPILVCTGATNQSVMNIIDCFGRGSRNDILFQTRWLPKVHSYGSFCCAATKADDVRHYQLELKDGSGLSASMEAPEYVEAAEAFFLDCFQKQFNTKPSVAGAARSLQKLLRSEHQRLDQSIQRLSGLGFLAFLRSLCSKQKSHSYEELAKLLAQFDPANRHKLFLIATHYWEARWILACREHLSSKKRQDRPRKGLDCFREAWERRAMITPAFVATLTMVPRFFRFDRHHPTPPIDLLIFDEAGQIPTEMGAPCLALASKALIVGDCLQLEPYWNVQPHIDRGNLHTNKIAKTTDADSWRKFSERGLLASNGSLMKLAMNSAEYSEDGMPGIFLAEQRRSLPELVAFCNTIAYENRLLPMRTSSTQFPLPPFGYIHIPGKNELSGTSRLNRFEAREIVNWILEHEERLLNFYKARELADVVAIITPFAAQHKELRRKLPQRLGRMTVGTVGGLQGAERPVVLFSAVYDSGYDGRFFFDLNVNMLNVAVSRARDSFIVFGDMSIFSAEKRTPSGVLAQFLFARPENELPPAVGGMEQEESPYPKEESARRLASLDEHISALREALLQAQHEVIVTSGSISSGAIRQDRLHEIIRDSVARGVNVSVFTDYDLNRTADKEKENSVEGMQLLRDAGAEVHVVSRIHNKSLAIDGHTIVEGSFNWLSANRHAGNRHQKHETSWIISGPIAREEIERLKDEMAYRLSAVNDLGQGELNEDERFF